MNIIKICDEREEFFAGVDGFIYWWPGHGGSLSSHHLREIADELDKRNAGWQAMIDNDPALNSPAPCEDNFNEQSQGIAIGTCGNEACDGANCRDSEDTTETTP